MNRDNALDLIINGFEHVIRSCYQIGVAAHRKANRFDTQSAVDLAVGHLWIFHQVLVDIDKVPCQHPPVFRLPFEIIAHMQP